MRHTLLKLMTILLVTMLALSGCNLIGVDAMKKLEEDFAALDKDYSTALVEYEGGTITKGDVIGTFATYYNYYTQMYSSFGMQIDSQTVESIKQQALESAVETVALNKQFESRKLSLSQEEQDEAQQAADTSYQQVYDSFYAQTTGKDEALRARQTEYNMYANGYSKDSIVKSQLDQAKREKVEADVKAEISELTDDELKTAYDEKVKEDEAQYSGNPGAFESAMSSENDIVTWVPEGYRTVKHILVKPADDVLQAVTSARGTLNSAKSALEGFESELAALKGADAAAEASEAAADETEAEEDTEAEPTAAPREAADIQADIDNARAEADAAQAAVTEAEQACLDSVKEKTDEIYAKIDAGEDFAALIAEYGEDPGMQNEPSATRGYYVCANSTTWDQNFTDGAMALEKVGDVSRTPVISSSGVHIIRYESDATPGAVPLEDIKDKLKENTMETRRDEHYEEELKSWTEALKPEYHLDAFTIG